MVEEVGMTNEQYKGMLLDELDVWKDLQELLENDGKEEALKKINKQIEKIGEKLKF